MTNNIQSHYLLFRYGTMLLLVTTAILMLLTLYNIKIGNRVAVKIIREHSGEIYCYIPQNITTIPGDSLLINVSSNNIGQVKILVKEVKISNTGMICKVAFISGYNPIRHFYIADGFIETDRKRLLNLVFLK